MLFVALAYGCKKDDGISVPLQNEVNEFVWLSMNSYYYWVDEIEDLSIEKYPTYNALYAFLNTYSKAEDLFDDLLYKDDRFSWIVDDYEELENSFQGISKSFGYELRLLRIADGSDDLMAYVKYVVPNGPADNAGLKRGDLFTKVNGISMTVSNYFSLLFESESYTLTLSQIQDGVITSTDQEVALTAVQLTENPILLSSVLEPEASVKVGYLVYNQFVNSNSYHEELNDVFGEFNNAGVSDLVLDLRYNGGGSVTTSRILASMIYGKASANDILGSIVYNSNLSHVNTDLSFFTSVPFFNSEGEQTSSFPMNRLNLNRIFILTSGSSASASEFIIAGLMPYMDVTLIGTKTVGKNVGSITLYDSPDEGYLDKGSDLNPNHKYAIQPIISQLSNSEGFTDYINGFQPDFEIDEKDYLENLSPLGDPTEPLLVQALEIITGTARSARKPDNGMRVIYDSNMEKEHVNTILLDGKDLPVVLNSNLIRTQ